MKKITSMLLSVLLAFTFCAIPAQAEEPTPPEQPQAYNDAALYLNNFIAVYSSVKLTGNQLQGTATFVPKKTYPNYSYTMYFEYSSNKTNWYGTGDEWSGSLSGDDAVAHTITVSKGYYYRLTVEARGASDDIVVHSGTASYF